MSAIVIEKWYGKETTKLINKNVIERVEFAQIDITIGGLEVAKNVTTDSFGGFTKSSLLNYSWFNRDSKYKDAHYNDVKYLKTIDVKDLNVANYDVKIKMVGTEQEVKKEGAQPTERTFTRDCLVKQVNGEGTGDMCKFTMLTNGSKAFPKLTVSATGILIEFGNVLQTSNYVIQNEYGSVSYAWTTFINSIELVVSLGAYKIVDSKVVFGQVASEKGFAINSNELISNRVKVGAVNVAQSISSEILQKYAKGLKTIELTVPICKYYDDVGALVVDNENGAKRLIENTDIIILKKRGKSLYNKIDGSAMQFEVTQSNIIYDGKAKLQIKAREVI